MTTQQRNPYQSLLVTGILYVWWLDVQIIYIYTALHVPNYIQIRLSFWLLTLTLFVIEYRFLTHSLTEHNAHCQMQAKVLQMNI